MKEINNNRIGKMLDGFNIAVGSIKNIVGKINETDLTIESLSNRITLNKEEITFGNQHIEKILENLDLLTNNLQNIIRQFEIGKSVESGKRSNGTLIKV
ncbi:MAG: hypothetical protein V1720_12200 [bacterium]